MENGKRTEVLYHYAGLTQLGECLPYKQEVRGSSPLSRTPWLPKHTKNWATENRVKSLIYQYHYTGFESLGGAKLSLYQMWENEEYKKHEEKLQAGRGPGMLKDLLKLTQPVDKSSTF